MKHLQDIKIYFLKNKNKQMKKNKQRAGGVKKIITSKYLKQSQYGSSDKENGVQ